MLDRISSFASRIVRSPETGSGSTPTSGVQLQSSSVDGASSFSRTQAVDGAKAAGSVDAKINAAIWRVGQILTAKLVQAGQPATFSAPGVTALMLFAANATKPGAERDGYLKALGLEGLSIEQVNKGASDLATRLGAVDENVKVAFANLAVSVAQKTGGFNKSFVDGAKSGINTSVIDKPVTNDKEVTALTNEMNKFASDHTLGLIDKPFSEGTIGDLVWGLFSTVAFQGYLTHPFVDGNELIEDPGYAKRLKEEKQYGESLLANAYTGRDGKKPPVEQLAAADWLRDAEKYLGFKPFRLRDDISQADVIKKLGEATKAVDGRMKLQTGGLHFLDNARFSGVMLPYGKNEGAYFVAMIPKDGVSTKDLLLDVGTPLFNAALKNAKARSHRAEDEVQMAAFKTKFKPNGVLQAFQAIAPLTFSELTAKGSRSPNGAILEAVINFTARKTEAAQIAGMMVLESAIAPEPIPPMSLIIDKPYAYAIVTADDQLPIWQGVQ